ncbi:MAG: hypothetical protein EBS71_07525 [Actinobacteria bacterium]|nr:hypothetical protein [Actinomycetota bacterium]
MIVHLVDGTYELYRQFYGQLGRHTDEHENAGVMGVLSSTPTMRLPQRCVWRAKTAACIKCNC